MSFLKRLKHFDAYPKTLEDFRVKTFSGAAISVICGIIITTLFIYEWHLYTTKEVQQELFVDLTRNQKFHINFDITFPRLPCQLISIDAIDVSGEQQIHVLKGLEKRYLNSNGDDITESIRKARQNIKDIPESTTTTTTTKASVTSDNVTCGSCYGAENSRRQCCNTCDDVKEAYREKNWQFSPIGVKQCKEQLQQWMSDLNKHEEVKGLTDEEMKIILAKNEGCRIMGFLEVNKVAGNFHIAPGNSYQENHVHVHDIRLSQVSTFNTSHSITSFYFGEDTFPNQVNPLDGTSHFGDENTPSVAYSYFIKIVPTTYQFVNGEILNNSYQYSVTKSHKAISINGDQSRLLPGLFFSYELSPIMVKFIEKEKSFTHFLTSCCAIIGGLFTIAGMIDALIYRNYNLYKKYQMNKLS